MDKKQEIKVLQSLKDDTYFKDFFGKDIDQMCANISNDFAIESGCMFNQKASLLERQLKEADKKAKESKELFVKGIISDFDGNIPASIYQRLVADVGQLFIINFKRENGFPLIEDEIDWLVKEVNK